MTNEHANSEDQAGRALQRRWTNLPRPSPQFRRRAWHTFQRALDPLARPKPLRRQH